MDDESLFAQPLSEWTDDDIRIMLPLVAERRAALELVDPWQAERLNDLVGMLAAERDARAALYRAAEDASNPFQVKMPTRILVTAASRRTRRRHRHGRDST
jgi:hypothetical protein